MAGLIRREDLEELRNRIDIREVVEGYVTLKRGGLGSWKGLCPFHDERTPSFNVRPQAGQFHCFGCGASGDVISFLQKIDHMSFTEAVEHLAARIGLTLRYDKGTPGAHEEEVSRRQRLLDAHKMAAEFFRDHLFGAEARLGREFLAGRGFTSDDAAYFGVGFAPQSWDALLRHLRARGCQEDVLRATGMFSSGQSGDRFFDRFRGRLIWPIRNLVGETIGFGARRLFAQDKGPKYLNTPETPLYKKSQVLYGIDLAKKAIVQAREIVVVEGYTDVMACHLAGIGTAVATCGTAFGEDHVRLTRRLLSDDHRSSIVLTFDGDEAGQNAARKVFDLQHEFLAQTFVAVDGEGRDPCELRQDGGAEAVQALIASKKPLIEFSLRMQLRDFEARLDSVEGRSAALRATTTLLGSIRDRLMRNEYSRVLADWIGSDPVEVMRAVEGARRQRGTKGGTVPVAEPQRNRAVAMDPQTLREQRALEVVLQLPHLLKASDWQELARMDFQHPLYQEIAHVLLQAGVPEGDQWARHVAERAPENLRTAIADLAFAPLPVGSEEQVRSYASSVLRGLMNSQLERLIREKTSVLYRSDARADPEGYRVLQRELLELQSRRRALQEE